MTRRAINSATRFALGMLCLLALCQPLRAQERYLDQVNGFSIVVPGDWTPYQVPNAAYARKKGSNVLAVVPVKNLTMETMVNRLAQAWRERKMKRTLERTYPINEVPSHMEVWENSGGAVISTVLVSGDRAYAVMIETPPGLGKTEAEGLVQIIHSFRVERSSTAPPAQAPPVVSPPVTAPQPPDDPEQNDF